MIKEFQRQYRFLSNFWPCKILFGDDVYPSVEHAYQAAKTLDKEVRLLIRTGTPGQAKRLGRDLKVREGWSKIRIEVMRDLVTQKFSLEPLRTRLINTYPHVLQEENRWGDEFWGVCRGKGQNILGEILMKIRNKHFGVR